MVLWALFVRLLEQWRSDHGRQGESLICEGQGYLERAITWGSIAAVAFTVFNGYILCNQAYHRMEAMTVTTTSIIERMVARIEQMPEWESDMPVYFADPRPLVNENYQVDVERYDRMENLEGTEIVPWYNERAVARYMNVYLRFPVTLATEEQKEKLDEDPAVGQMPSFPDKDSIQVIDGVLVVKVSNGEEQ